MRWCAGKFVSEEVYSNDNGKSCSQKLFSLNFSNKKIHLLDALSEITERAPQVKILKLSRNLVRG